jgi:hypothetical protein
MHSVLKIFHSTSGTPRVAVAALSLLWLPLSMGAHAQSAEVSQTASTTAVVIPQQVRYAGALPSRAGVTVEAVFKIYATAEGGEPLWTETQQVAVGADGTYSVLLGAASQSGLPQGVFAAGQARWVGVTVDRGEEQSRSPLASVAYAMKAGDAESVGGLAAATLATKSDLAKLSQTVATAVQAQPQFQPEVTPTGSGTPNYVPLWTASGTLGNSGIYQAASGFVGIGTATPGGPLQLSTGAQGGANATMMLTQTNAGSGNYYADLGLYNSKGLIGNLSALGAGYPAGNLYGANDVVFLGGQQNAGTNLIMLTNTSGALKFGTGGYAIANERMRIGAAGGVSVGNSYVTTDPGAGNLIVSGKVGVGTKTPAAVLEVNGTAKFDGLVSFASGQTFPGAGTGTITGITTTSPLAGSGTSGSVALSLNTSALETTLNGKYAQLGAADTFTTATTFSKGLTASGTSGATGVYGSSDTGYGVLGRSNSGQGLVGDVTSPADASAGVLGYTGSALSATYSAEATLASAGVWADTSGGGGSSAPVALFATADAGYGAAVFNASAPFPALLVFNTAGTGATISAGTTGDGMDVTANLGDGVDAITGGGGSGVYGFTLTGAQGSAGVWGVGVSPSNVGASIDVYGAVWGDSGIDDSTIGSDWSAGVYGTADNGRAGVFVNESNSYPTMYLYNYGTDGTGNVKTGLFGTLMAASATGTCGIDGGSMSCTGPIKSLVSAGGSRTVETYSMQSPENWMEDFGSGSVVNGHASISLDPAFAQTVSADASYKVFITPNGESKGLYVTAKTASGFEVRESNGGSSSLSFDYRIVAKRAGYEAKRMVDVTDAFTGEMSRAKLAKVEGAKPVVRLKKPSFLEQQLKKPHRTIIPRPAAGTVLPQVTAVPARQAASK